MHVDHGNSLRGVYFVLNAGVTNVALDLWAGNVASGSAIFGMAQNTGLLTTGVSLYHQLWLIERFQNEPEAYTFQCLRTGTFLEAEGGNDGTKAKIVAKEYNASPTQRWIIKKDLEGYSRIQNVATKIYVELSNTADGYKRHALSGCEGDRETPNSNQRWSFDRVSLTSQEIRQVINPSPTKGSFEYKSNHINVDYVVLPQAIWHDIWKTSKLQERRIREQVFDYEDLASAYKTEFGRWVYDNIRVDHVKVLCGLMLGKASPDSKYKKCYNFTLTDDHKQILFFDPTENTFKVETLNEEPFLGYY